MDEEFKETMTRAWELKREAEITYAAAARSLAESRQVLTRAGDAFLVGASLLDRADFDFAMGWYTASDPDLRTFRASLPKD